VTGEELLHVARSVPSLIELSISPADDNNLSLDDFYLALGKPNTSGKILLPLLQKFELSGKGFTVSWDLLFKGKFFPFEVGKTLNTPRRPSITELSIWMHFDDNDTLPVISKSVLETMDKLMDELSEEVDLEIFAGLGLGGAVNLVDSDPSQ